MNAYDLTDDEALLLDGRVNEKAQARIEAARQRVAMREKFAGLSDGDRKFLVDVLAEARTKGRLHLIHTRMMSCGCCGKAGGYATHSRTTRNHRRGTPNYDRPIMVAGVSLARDFINIQGYPRLAACHDCFGRLTPLLKEELAGVAAALPDVLAGPERWDWHQGRRCKSCGWEGHEGDMGRRPALMEGTYPASCPTCKAENTFFGPTLVEVTDKFVLTRATGSDTGSREGT